jgi:hypothetical protein
VTIVPHVLKASAKYDPVKDLDPIGLIGGSTLAFFVGEAFPARTVNGRQEPLFSGSESAVLISGCSGLR